MDEVYEWAQLYVETSLHEPLFHNFNVQYTNQGIEEQLNRSHSSLYSAVHLQ